LLDERVPAVKALRKKKHYTSLPSVFQKPWAGNHQRFCDLVGTTVKDGIAGAAMLFPFIVKK
jgi:hypothetical protein